EFRFAYGRSAQSYRMERPPHTLAMSAVSPQLVSLFERAFAPGSKEPSAPNARPTGLEWVNALSVFRQSLRMCQADRGHHYAPHVPSCSWCDLMQRGAPNYFYSVAFCLTAGSHRGPAFVLAAVWARIEKVCRPNLAYQRPALPKGGRSTALLFG